MPEVILEQKEHLVFLLKMKTTNHMKMYTLLTNLHKYNETYGVVF